MALALFGKLPAKRDFVARRTPAAFLSAIEPWLQQSMAQSRQMLGPIWAETYLAAPIWRFWLAPSICGHGAMGALMPSVDAVGRYFPLALAAVAEEGLAYEAPVAADEPYFESLEAALLSALVENGTLEALLSAIASIEEPQTSQRSPQDGAKPQSLWWTLGGEAFPPQRFAARGLPPPAAFASLLTGMRDPARAAS